MEKMGSRPDLAVGLASLSPFSLLNSNRSLGWFGHPQGQIKKKINFFCGSRVVRPPHRVKGHSQQG
jgi:hypothetical protein